MQVVGGGQLPWREPQPAGPPLMGAPHETATPNIDLPLPPPPPAMPMAADVDVAAAPATTWPLAIPLTNGGFNWVTVPLPEPRELPALE